MNIAGHPPRRHPIHLETISPNRRHTRVNLTRFQIEPSSSFKADIKTMLGPTALAQ